MAAWKDQQNQKPNNTGFLVIGAGLPRTGTLSLSKALGQLLNGPCYHMSAVFASKPTDPDIKHWNKALNQGHVKTAEWIDFLEGRGFRAGVDFPVSLFYKELMEVFPDAKVILTKRDPVKWYQSVKSTIYTLRQLIRDPAMVLFMTLRGFYPSMKFAHDVTAEVFDVIEEGEEAAIKYFNNWVSDVKAHVPEDRLLVYEVKDGWQPLCKFLGVPVPTTEEFPHVNDTATLRTRFKRVKILARTVLYGIPTAALLYFYCDKLLAGFSCLQQSFSDILLTTFGQLS